MVKLNKIYTRTGDDGTTGLVDGSRLPKHAARMEAIGAVDEANSALGLAAVVLAGVILPGGGDHAAALYRIQNDLFDLWALTSPLRRARVMISLRPKWCCGLWRDRSRGWKARLTPPMPICNR